MSAPGGGSGSDRSPYDVPIRTVPIRDGSIRLGQFLKLANLIDSGSDARPLMINGQVLVNDEVETRRGRQLHPGDVVELIDAGPGGRARVSRAEAG